MSKKKTFTQVNNLQVTNNITNITNTINATGITNTSKPSSKHFLLYFAIAITIVLNVNISIVIIYNCNNPKNTVTIPIDNISDTQPPVILSNDYYTETVVHGSKISIIFNNNQPVIKIKIPQYETDIVTDKLYADSQEITQTTKTIVKIADITHIYYPDADDYEEIYNTYYMQ